MSVERPNPTRKTPDDGSWLVLVPCILLVGLVIVLLVAST